MKSKLAIWGLVSSILGAIILILKLSFEKTYLASNISDLLVSLFNFWNISIIILIILGLIFSIKGLNQIRKNNLEGKWIVWVTIIILILITIFMVINIYSIFQVLNVNPQDILG